MNALSKYQHLAWLLLLVPIYLFLFAKLGSTHIRLWDEGWFAVHAIEMWQNGSWLVSYFDGVPSYTSSKPPLQTWLQIGSLSLLGISELALRLPSAIAATITVLALYFFVKRHSSASFGIMAAMVLLTSVGFIGFHTARGAEADSLLTLSLLLQAICFYEFVQSQKWKWFAGLTLSLGLAFWVKSVAGFLMLPGFAIYALAYHKAIIAMLLTSWQFYAGIVAAIALVASYVLLRENAQPGYVAMFFKSNVGRYTASVGHDNGFEYYLRNMLDGRYVWWIALAAIGMVIAFMTDGTAKSLSVFAAICALSYLLVISISKSKLMWYDMPFYPLAAIPAAFGVQKISSIQEGRKRAILVLIVFLFPTYQMFLHAQANRLNLQEMNFESQEIFLNRAFKRGDNLNQLVVIHDHFDGSLIFYRHKFATIDQQLILQNSIDGIGLGDSVLVRSDEHKKQLQDQYQLEQLDEYKTAVMYKITASKSNKQSEIKST